MLTYALARSIFEAKQNKYRINDLPQAERAEVEQALTNSKIIINKETTLNDTKEAFNESLQRIEQAKAFLTPYKNTIASTFFKSKGAKDVTAIILKEVIPSPLTV